MRKIKYSFKSVLGLYRGFYVGQKVRWKDTKKVVSVLGTPLAPYNDVNSANKNSVLLECNLNGNINGQVNGWYILPNDTRIEKTWKDEKDSV